MKKLLIGTAAIALLIGSGVAFAQTLNPTGINLPYVQAINIGDAFQDVVNGNPLVGNVYATAAQLRSYILGQNSQHLATPTPTVSTSICGGSAATVNGTDLSGQVTEGATASTSCVLTFATPFITAPECFVSLNNVADTALKCATSTTALTVTQTSASSHLMNYLVVGLPGG